MRFALLGLRFWNMENNNIQHRQDDQIHLSLIGHSTVLINMYGKWILTDPVLFDKIGVKIGKRKVGMQRVSKPALHEGDIHHLDYILLSHAHMDHRDKETIKALVKKFPHQIHIVCPKNTKGLLARYKGIKSITELERGEEKDVDGLFVRA
jgi:L-ascorbate metabolism protein UlaG (beta-lactamase superfamily)